MVRRITPLSKIALLLVAVAIIAEFYLGFTYLNSADSYDQYFGGITLLEAILGITGLIIGSLIKIGMAR